MQPILVSYEAPFRNNLQKKNTSQVAVALTGPVLFANLDSCHAQAL